ncbi:MAG: hypothetical protein ACXWXN_09510, partial [Actinomycetota bacterium]
GIFLGLVFVAYVYIWRMGGFDWSETAATPIETDVSGGVMADADADLASSLRDPEAAGAR